jgi:hypothetical protein
MVRLCEIVFILFASNSKNKEEKANRVVKIRNLYIYYFLLLLLFYLQIQLFFSISI